MQSVVHTHRRIRRSGSLLALLLIGLTACGGDAGLTSDTTNNAAGLGSAAPVATDAESGSTKSTEVDVGSVQALVDACVEYVPLAAFLDDEEMSAIVSEVGSDPTAMETRCKEIVRQNPKLAKSMAKDLKALKEATAAPATTSPPTEAPTTPAPTTQAPTTPSSVVETGIAVMPNVVCMDLQTAQDTIQEAGVFFSSSFDATGQDRMQIIDSNWLVVSQYPEPGTPIGEFDANLGVVKLGEATC